MNTNLPPLFTPSRRTAIEMVITYAAVTVDMLMHRLNFSKDVCNGIMGRLVRDLWLEKQYLAEGISIFHATPQAAYRLKLPSNRGKHLGLQAAIGHLPIGLDCERRKCRPIPPMEVESGYLSRVSAVSAVYTHGEDTRVVRLLVDYGKEPSRLASKIGEWSREMVSACPQQVLSGDFGIRVLVPTLNKVPLITQRFQFKPPAGNCAIEFGEVPELQRLLLSRTEKRDASLGSMG